jgi:hypothetical protein
LGYGEVVIKATDKRFRRSFEVRKDAEGYETYVELIGAECPTMEGTTASGLTFAQVAKEEHLRRIPNSSA